MLEGNREAIQAWNTVLFDKFSRFKSVIINGFETHGTRALELYPPQRGARVVDIGCGFGDTAIQIGKLVGPEGRVVGVDAAERFVESSRKDAAGMENVSFAVADVEEAVPGGPYDYAFARFGTMFFASPVFAFRNTRKALVPGGRIVFCVWRKRESNECFHAAEVTVRELLGHPAKGDNVTCGPGPFAQASADLVTDQLLAAGFKDVAFHRNDAPILVGNDLDHAVELALTIGPAGEVVRLAGEDGVKRRDEVAAALRKTLSQFATPQGGIAAPSSIWIVSATNPG